MPIASAPKTRQVLWIGALIACDPTGAELSPISVREEPPTASAVEPSRRDPQLPPVLATPARATGEVPAATVPNDGIAGQGGGAAPPLLSGSPASAGSSAAPSGGSAGGGSAGGSAATGGASGTPSLSTDVRSPGCALGTPSLSSGTYDLEVGAQLRSYDLVAPAASSAAAPLLIALHGYAMTSAEMAAMTGWSARAESDGAIVVYPSGLGEPAGWDAGNCCGADAADDLAFIDGLLDELEAIACVDRARVYAAGFSNGGMLAKRMACERSERIAAVAAVAGSLAMPLDDCNPSEPVPVLHVHGTADAIVPYFGGRGSPLLDLLGATDPTFSAVDSEIERFASLNGCTATVQTVLETRSALCERHTDCEEDAQVELCSVLGGGHTWPGGAGGSLLLRLGGAAAQTLQTSDVVWEFLSEQRL